MHHYWPFYAAITDGYRTAAFKKNKKIKKTVLIDFVQKPTKSFDVGSGIENRGSWENHAVQIEKNLISACLWDVATLLK